MAYNALLVELADPIFFDGNDMWHTGKVPTLGEAAHQEGHHDTSMTLEVVNGWLANATGERPARYAVYHPEVLGPGVLPDAQE